MTARGGLVFLGDKPRRHCELTGRRGLFGECMHTQASSEASRSGRIQLSPQHQPSPQPDQSFSLRMLASYFEDTILYANRIFPDHQMYLLDALCLLTPIIQHFQMSVDYAMSERLIQI